jgi:citrate lyase subunit gamma (acyl carrier protein)
LIKNIDRKQKKMAINKTAQAGSLESCDILITVEPAKEGSGIIIELNSPAIKSYGEQILAEIKGVAKKMNISNAKITAIDKGALSYCITARTEAALTRALGEK